MPHADAVSSLITPDQLAARLARPESPLRLFDVTVHLQPAPGEPVPYRVASARADFEAAHIPGAAFIDQQAQLSDPAAPLAFTRLPPDRLATAFGAAGLGDGEDCVLYSSTSPMWATRAWWLLRSIGVPARVLDGGLAGWRSGARAVASGPGATWPTAGLTALEQPRLWATREEVLAAIDDGAVCTINALPAAVHDGSAGAGYHGRRGHIAGSVNLPYPALLQPDGTLQPDEVLRDHAAGSGALQRPRAICYCGGGIAATLTALVLLRLGHRDVAVYDGSLAEWAADPSLPMSV